MRIRGEKQRLSWLVVVALVALSAGFAVPPPPSQGSKGTPVPRGRIDTLSDRELERAIAAAKFDSSPWAGDEQRLMVGRYVADSPSLARYGPLVKIEPAERSYSRPLLERGRIVARFINQEADSYPKLGILPHSITYWWIEGRYTTDSGRGGRAVFIATRRDPESRRIRILRRTPARLWFEAHRWYKSPGPSARWYWVDRDEQGWYSCPSGCCRSQAE